MLRSQGCFASIEKSLDASAGLGVLIGLPSNPLIFGALILLPLLAILLMNLFRICVHIQLDYSIYLIICK